MVETSTGGATGDGNSITPSDQALNVGALSNYRQRNIEIRMGGSFDVNAFIDREIEKRKIREEILTYGLRRRELEDEVIRELMIERELAARGGSLLNSPYLSLQLVTDMRKEPANATPTPNALQANNSGTSNAGSKRKFEMQTIDNDDGATLAGCGEKSRKGCSCELCQVSATNEKGPRDHLNGKKDKTKEEAVQRTALQGSNESDIRVEETDKSSDLAITGMTTGQNLSNIVGVNQGVVNNLEASSHKQQHAETNAGSGLRKKHKMELKNEDTDFKCWCKMCEIGTSSEALMTAHRAGEQHMSLLKERGGCVIVINTRPVHVQYIDLTKNTPLNMEKEVVLGNSDGQGGVLGNSDDLENADKGGVGVENGDKCTMESH